MVESTLHNTRELFQMLGIKAWLALATTWALKMVGHPESAALLLFMLLFCDFALGIVRAWRSATLRGERITQGAFKFFRYWLAVAILVTANGAVKIAFPSMPVSVSDTFIAYLSINEAFSCIGHLAYFGMPVPEAFIKRLRTYHDSCLSGDWDGVDRRKP